MSDFMRHGKGRRAGRWQNLMAGGSLRHLEYGETLQRFLLRLPADLLKSLENLAEGDGVSTSEYIRRALQRNVKERQQGYVEPLGGKG